MGGEGEGEGGVMRETSGKECREKERQLRVRYIAEEGGEMEREGERDDEYTNHVPLKSTPRTSLSKSYLR